LRAERVGLGLLLLQDAFQQPPRRGVEFADPAHRLLQRLHEDPGRDELLGDDARDVALRVGAVGDAGTGGQVLRVVVWREAELPDAGREPARAQAVAVGAGLQELGQAAVGRRAEVDGVLLVLQGGHQQAREQDVQQPGQGHEVGAVRWGHRAVAEIEEGAVAYIAGAECVRPRNETPPPCFPGHPSRVVLAAVPPHLSNDLIPPRRRERAWPGARMRSRRLHRAGAPSGERESRRWSARGARG